MTSLYERVLDTLAKLKKLCPAGYAIAADIEFTAPEYLFQTYPKAWLDEYSSRGLVLRDPTVSWGLQNEGEIEWADLIGADEAGVFKYAKDHWLEYGFTISTINDGFRSISSFSSGREFTDTERAEIRTKLHSLLDELKNAHESAPEEIEKIKKISIALTHP